ncbi:MAG: hypothetical protein Q8M73_08985 [Actinomycetota bacterium]|nr:hypothetical protein [Actinomycetota bacterium]
MSDAALVAAAWVQALGTLVALIAVVVTVFLWKRDKGQSEKDQRLAMARSVALQIDHEALTGGVWRFKFQITNFGDYPIDDVNVYLAEANVDCKTLSTVVPKQTISDYFAASSPVHPQHPDCPIGPIEFYFTDVWGHRWRRGVGVCEDLEDHKEEL